MRIYTSLLSCLVILVSCMKDVKPVSMEFRVAERVAAEGLEQMVLSGWGHQDTFFVHTTIELTEGEVVASEVTMIDEHPAIALIFSERGASVMSRLTAENVGRHLAMILDGTLVSAPLIRAKIDGGRAIINGDFTHEQAEQLADRIVAH